MIGFHIFGQGIGESKKVIHSFNTRNKEILILLCIALCMAGLAGCGQAPAESVIEEPSDIEDFPIIQEESDMIDREEQQVVDYSAMDISEKVHMYLSQYNPGRPNDFISPYGSMPFFSDINQIDEEWLFRTFYIYKYSEYPENNFFCDNI